ncbi:MAG: hypothetical protein AB1Z98_28340 [Nannocystaceae bacterium]
MHPLLRKLNFKAHPRLVVLAPPPELGPLLEAMAQEVPLGKRLGKDETFVLVFVRDCADIATRAPKVVAKLGDDALLWWAYPKKSSKRYHSDIGRDDSWQALGALGFEGVRQVAIDEDWSALRFRRAETIKTMTRDPSRALSEHGRARLAKTRAAKK